MPLILTRIGRGTIIVAILVVFNLNENKLLLSIGSLSLKYLDGSPVFGSDLITLSNIGQSSAAIKKGARPEKVPNNYVRIMLTRWSVFDSKSKFS